MKELSIFVDESGDFGEYNYHSPYYIITMVFHNQSDDITNNIEKFNNELVLLGFDKQHCVHNGPIIRREHPYEHMDIKERRRIFNKMVAFTRQLNISFKCFHIKKKNLPPTSTPVKFPYPKSQLCWYIHRKTLKTPPPLFPSTPPHHIRRPRCNKIPLHTFPHPSDR